MRNGYYQENENEDKEMQDYLQGVYTAEWGLPKTPRLLVRICHRGIYPNLPVSTREFSKTVRKLERTDLRRQR